LHPERVLDLCSGAGGAAMGLHRAWPKAKITGVDIRPQPSYPFTFVQADALTFSFDCPDCVGTGNFYGRDEDGDWLDCDSCKGTGNAYDFIWASPPCQGFSKTRKIMEGKGIANPRADNSMIPRLRERLEVSGIPYVIENVPGSPLINPVRLCGTMFNLRVLRHRLFEASFPIRQLECGRHGGTNSHRGYSTGAEFVTVGGHNFRRVEGAAAMGIDWMKSRAELSEAIPPAYSEFIARQLR